MQFVLPFPPSVNHYYRNVGRRTLISQEGREYRKTVCGLLAGVSGIRTPPMDGRIALSLEAFPPDQRRRDLDNLHKSVADSLQHAGVYEDDSQIDLLVARRAKAVPQGRLLVEVVEFPLRLCPVCGGKWLCSDTRQS